LFDSVSTWGWREFGLLVLAGAGVGTVYILATGGNRLPGTVLLLNLRNGAFPGVQPAAAVVIPPHYDPSAPLDVCVYFHGWNNCVANMVAEDNGPCRPGGPAHYACRLASQLAQSSANTVLIVPELQVEASSGNVGRLGQQGALSTLLDEILGEHLVPYLGHRTSSQIRSTTIMCHSGGYTVAAAALQHGGLSSIKQVVLLDALYGERPVFEGWITNNVQRFADRGPNGFRFVNIYTTGGGTRENSRAMASAVTRTLASARLPGLVYDNDEPGERTSPDIQNYSIVFMRTRLPHNDMTRVYPRVAFEYGALVRT
jgi:hypothetical protein